MSPRRSTSFGMLMRLPRFPETSPMPSSDILRAEICCLPAQKAVPIAHLAVSPEHQTAALSLELEVMDAGRCTGARKLEMKLQGILEFSEDSTKQGNIGKRDDGWLDAALKLEC